MKKLIFAIALLAPAQLAAQTGSTLSPFVASDGSISGTPMLVGANYTREYGWLGLRLGGFVDVGSTPLGGDSGDGTSRVGVFGADLDALLFAGSPASPNASVIPYLLAGVGIQTLTGTVGSSFTTSYSYGVGLRTPLASWLSLDGEARYRQPLAADVIDVPEEVGSGLEFRFGISIRTSGARPRVRVPPASALASRPLLTSASAPAGSEAAARLRIAERTLDTADDYLGIRYTWGGSSPSEGFDCSGFVQYVFARNGVNLPRVSQDQARAGRALPLDLAVFEPGDLLAFASRGNRVDHIAIYAGNGRIIHSSASGNGVRIDDLYSQRGRWYLDHMVAARRVIDGLSGWSLGSR
ncbi:MAG TPA: C40 family peptidase [Longimicrobiaceae bacterium]